jgi:hypothetical protein
LTSTNDTAVTMTAACELGSHRCKGVVLSLTGESWDAQTPCSCDCHQEPDQVDDEEVALDLAADLLLERSLEDIHFAEGWS